MIAKCFEPEIDERFGIEELFYEPKSGIWIRLWKNSAVRHTLCLPDYKLKIDTVEPNKWYSVRATKSWCSNEYFEFKSRPLTSQITDDRDEYCKRIYKHIKPCYRNLDF